MSRLTLMGEKDGCGVSCGMTVALSLGVTSSMTCT